MPGLSANPREGTPRKGFVRRAMTSAAAQDIVTTRPVTCGP
ncbi:MAG: hypothetical protein ACRYF3_11735 [Janthinobacterium lividum]